MTDRKILLLGGTGAMGRNLVQILLKEDLQIFVTSRSRRESKSEQLHYIQGDAKDPEFLKKLLKTHWNVIVDFMVYNTETFQTRVNDLLNAADHYIFLSSSRVYADSKTPIQETSARLLDVSTDEAYLKTDEYALAKARQENILKTAGKKNWTIIRPYITFDTYRLQLGVMEKEAWLQRALSGRKILFSKDIAQQMTTMTRGFDVAKGIAAVAGKKSAMGEAFHITTKESHSWQEILNVYQEALEQETGKRPEVMLTEISPLINTGAEYQIRYDRCYNRRFDNAKICQFMSNEEFANSLESLREAIKDFLKAPKFLSKNVKQEALFDRLTGDWMKLQELVGIKTKCVYLIYRCLGELVAERIVFRAFHIIRKVVHG